METGFFTIADVQMVLSTANVNEARDVLKSRVDRFLLVHPNTKQENVHKVLNAINRSRTKEQLAYAVTNFVLAHPSEGLKVI